MRTVTKFAVRPGIQSDKRFVDALVKDRWGAEVVVTRGRVQRPSDLPAFIAEREGQPLGLITYEFRGDDCEIVTLDSLEEGAGVGSALVEAVCQEAKSGGCARVWLITTNDNLKAIGFYQKRGFVLAALHRNAIARSRELKPSIPLLGEAGIPIRDEIELERRP